MLCVIDHHDSFTYNLVHYFHELGAEVRVVLDDERSAEEVVALEPTHLILSPGAGPPREARLSRQLLLLAAERRIPTLGVCLGHQVIGEAFGARVQHARRVVHGKASAIRHTAAVPFVGLPNPFQAARYHSLVLARESLPECLEMTAWTSSDVGGSADVDGDLTEVMAIRHREAPIFGVQFHPESVLSEHGHALLEQFLRVCA